MVGWAAYSPIDVFDSDGGGPSGETPQAGGAGAQPPPHMEGGDSGRAASEDGDGTPRSRTDH
eukprot:6741402-Alexandrium_andersonii.AAC.1